MSNTTITRRSALKLGGAAALTALVAGCSGSGAASGSKKVGIIKFIDHPSLNQIESSIKKELDAKGGNGVTYDYSKTSFDGQGDASVLNQIAKQVIDDGVDVIIPIATPAAQVVQSATEGKRIPVVFAAVSDPVTAKLVNNLQEPGGTITGTSDMLNTEAMMNLITIAKPDIKKIGLLYSNSEDASKVPVQEAKTYCVAHNIDTVEKTGTTTDEISQAVEALIAEGVEAVFTPTDNTVQAAELAFYEKLAAAKVPHFGGADSFALNGALVGYGVDYAGLGTATADMAVEVMGGKDTASLPVRTFDNGIVTINTETAAACGIDLATLKAAYAGTSYCTGIVETVTAKEF